MAKKHHDHQAQSEAVFRRLRQSRDALEPGSDRRNKAASAWFSQMRLHHETAIRRHGAGEHTLL
jgi:hypothetical protein